MMDPKYLYIFLTFIFGYFLYLKKPNVLCIYWLSLQPIVMPLFVLIFARDLDTESFDKLYFSYPVGVNYLFIIILLLELTQKQLPKFEVKSILLPIVLLVFFLIIQGMFTHFSLPSIVRNSILAFNTVCPLLLLIIDERFRPNSIALRKFVIFVVSLQVLFCILNVFGVTIYPLLNQEESFANHLISGTFGRYNHMTNYLTTIFFFISYDYYENKGINDFNFILLSIVIGVIVLFSGARMSLVLFLFTLFVFFFIYKRHHVWKLLILFVVFFVGWRFLMSSEVVSNKEADKGTGMERNIAGLSSFMQNDLDDDDSTVSLSFYLLAFYFNNPVFGNGYAYMGEDAYVVNSSINQSAFLADARIAYMIVEYGIVGVLVFFIIYLGVYKSLINSSTIRDKRLYKIAYAYFFICTLTEGGFFDIGIFSMLYIYGFQNQIQPQLNADSINDEVYEII